MENNNQNTDKDFSVSLKSKKNREGFWEIIKFALIALVIVIPFRMFVAQPFIVSGQSMFPTFHDGEYLIVDELSYIIGEPNRGDVVVFRYPGDTTRFFIKRIIGLPNEEIQIDNGEVKIINKENPKGFILKEPYLNTTYDTSKTDKTESGEYFVMGDNRNNSSDSRTWGKLPSKLLIGRAYLRLLPFQRISYLPGYYSEIK